MISSLDEFDLLKPAKARESRELENEDIVFSQNFDDDEDEIKEIESPQKIPQLQVENVSQVDIRSSGEFENLNLDVEDKIESKKLSMTSS